jgi:predicted outer membrane repeat protein
MPLPRLTLFALLGACALGACSRQSSAARLYFVVAGGSGNGRSWAEASGSLQDVLAGVHPGDEIWVASGTYRPGPPGSPRTATFMLSERVTLRGGFAGTEQLLEQRDPQNPPSILDGDLSGDDGPDFSGRADNCYHVLTAHMVESATLENFRVRGGYADGPALGPHVESGDQGSGMTVFHAHPHVIGCLFLDNWAQNHGTVNDHGGGLYEDCVFSGNHAELLGAGLYFHGDIEAHALRCSFLGNRTPGQGAGAYSRSALGSTFEDCTFLGNQAERGAGIYLAEGNATDVLRCSFEDNLADIGGGGAYVDAGTGLVQDCEFVANAAGHDVQGGGAGAGGSGGGGLWASFGAPRVEDCLFDSNSASFGGGIYLGDGSAAAVRRCDFLGGTAFEAGGLYVIQSPALAEDCLFVDNRASGGAFSVGGGMSVYVSALTGRRLRFVDNSAELGGGGLYSEGESPDFDRCEFVGNRALGEQQGWGGGYMAGYFTEARLTNCGFQGNRAHQGGGMFAIAFAAPTLVNATFSGNFAEQEGGALAALILGGTRLQNSICWGDLPQEFSGLAPLLERVCVFGGSDGDGNLARDPLFLSPPQPGPDLEWGTQDDLRGDLHLAPGSPCRDAGDNALLLPGEDVDLDGNPRFEDDPAMPDTGAGGPPTVDLGAYEAGPGR